MHLSFLLYRDRYLLLFRYISEIVILRSCISFFLDGILNFSSFLVSFDFHLFILLIYTLTV